MLILKNAASLNLRLLGAVTTPLEFYTTYYDGPSSSYGDSSGFSSGTSSVEMIAPTIGQYREVKFLSVCNKNTLQQATLYLEIVKPADTKQILYCTLDGLDTLLYANTEGFKVIDKFGKLKVTVATGGGGGGSGTVTAVSVVPVNGFSATIPDPTGNVQITLIAGDITPDSVSSAGLITTSGNITTTGSGNISSAGSISAAGTINGANLSGTNTGDQVNIIGNAATVTTNANLNGDVTSVGNSTTISNNAVTFTKLQNIATNKLLGRSTAATGNVEEITLGTNLSFTGTTLNATGGSGSVSSVSVVSANGFSGSVTNPTTTPAITISAGAITPASVAAVGTVTGSNLSGTNTGDQVNIPGNAATVTTNANLTGPVTSTGNATSITNNVITNAKLAQVSSISFKGRNTAVTGDIMDLTPTEATAMLNAFTSAEKGLVPPSGGGTGNFLRADGAWVTPAGGGSSVTNGTLLAAARGFAMP